MEFRLALGIRTPRQHLLHSIPFFAVHVLAVAGIISTGFTWRGFALALALYVIRMFFITAGYHRYFSHRTFKTSRFFQFVLALGGTLAAQKGPIWWASRHRWHHKYSDTPEDAHSPRNGLLWSHLAWFLGDNFTEQDRQRVPDLAKYPELVWLDRYYVAPIVAFGLVLYLIGGWHDLVWGLFVSTTLLWHGTFTINSLAHRFGTTPYSTGDDSRNNLALALITLGEGWHNNHHHYQRSTRQGFHWWQIDMAYYGLRALAAIGVVRAIHEPPRHVVEGRGMIDDRCVSGPQPTSSSAAPSSS